MRVLRLDFCRVFVFLDSLLLKCLRKASIYRSLGWLSDTWRSQIGDTCHNLIGLPMSSLTHARSPVSSLTRAGLPVSSLTRAEVLVSLLTRAEV